MLRIEIETDGEAFDDSGELARLLTHVVRKVDAIEPGWNLVLHDVNGNRVGRAWID